jgi:hypothetical protein
MKKMLAKLIACFTPSQPDPRMKLSIKDMPKYSGRVTHVVGDMRDHYPDGTHKSRQQRGMGQDG